MTLVQEATRIIESMPRRNQQIVLELLRVMGSRASDAKHPERIRTKK